MSEANEIDEQDEPVRPRFQRSGIFAMLGATVMLCLLPWPTGSIGLAAGIGNSFGLLALLAALGCILASPLPQYRDLRIGSFNLQQVALASAALAVVFLFVGFASVISKAGSPLASIYSLCIAGTTTWVAYSLSKAGGAHLLRGLDASSEVASGSGSSRFAALSLTKKVEPAEPKTGEGWFDDPSGRFTSRFFDGDDWTEWVLVDGQTIADPTFPTD